MDLQQPDFEGRRLWLLVSRWRKMGPRRVAGFAMLQLTPKASDRRLNLARLLMKKKGRLMLRLTDCRQALRDDSNLSSAHCGLGEALERKG